MSYQLDSNVAEKLKLFFSQFDYIDKVVIFGSRAKHNANPKSDIDLCIYSLEMTAKEFIKLKIELDELPILYKIDIVHFESSNDELKKNIVKDGKLFFNRTVQLTNVCEFQGGSQPPKSEWNDKKLDGYVRMLQIRDFTQGKDKYIQYIKDAKKLKKCTQNDILIGRYGASIGKILTGLEGAYNVAMMKVTPSEKINREYLYHFLKGRLFQNAIASIGSRAAQAGFNKEDLSKINIPLPSLTKQKQIAKTLDKAQELIELRKESIKRLDELSKSIFIDMFGDPAQNPMNWEKTTLSEVCLEKGKYGSGASAVEYDNKKPRYLRITDIKDDGTLKEEKKSPSIVEEQYYLEKNSIVFARSGATVGKTYLHLSDETLLFAGYLIKFKPNTNLINPLYLYYFTKTNYYDEWIKSKQNVVAQPNINEKEYSKLLIILPSLEIQENFANKIQKIEQQKNFYEKQLKKLQENFDALLAQSFKA